MLKLSASLGLKYFRSSKGAFVSFTSIMAVTGLTIGVAALIIVTSVMNGFEKELRDRILGVIPHVLIHSKEPISDYQLLIDQIEKNPDVEAAAPFIQSQALISIGNRSKGIALTGIDVKKESEVSILPDNMLMGSLESLNDNEIILGYWLAAHLGTSIGDEVNITTSEMRSSIIGSFPRSFKFIVSGIFELKAFNSKIPETINLKLLGKDPIMDDLISEVVIFTSSPIEVPKWAANQYPRMISLSFKDSKEPINILSGSIETSDSFFTSIPVRAIPFDLLPIEINAWDWINGAAASTSGFFSIWSISNW